MKLAYHKDTDSLYIDNASRKVQLDHLELSGLRGESGAVIITAAVTPRAGWAEAAAKHGPAGLLDGPSATKFEDEVWEGR